MDSHQKIGVFDSGLGGVSVVYTIHQMMPLESIVYIGDSVNAPYGTKSPEAVFEHSKAVCDRLVSEGVKAIVIACNTATSAAAERLRGLYDIPIIGMEPAVKPALKASEGTVLVLATEMTLREKKFQNLLASLKDSERVVKCPAPDLVTLVETQLSEKRLIRKTVAQYLDAFPEPDAIVLGCTHFIFLKQVIAAYYDGRVPIFDGNLGTARQLQKQLKQRNLLIESPQKMPATVTFLNEKPGYAELSEALFEELADMEKAEQIQKVQENLGKLLGVGLFDEKSEKIFKLYYGVGTERMDIQAISKEMKLSVKKLQPLLERMDKKVFNTLKKQPLF